MTKISVYNIDEYVTADDKWIGTDVNTYNKTKNFTPRKLSHYFNNNQVINTGVDLLYKYFTITPPETRPTGTLSFETEIGQTVNFSAISTFLLSKTTLKGNDVVEFLNFLVGTKVLLYKAKNINLFGNYKIVSVEEYLPEPNFLVVNVEFIEGNGFIEEDEDYMISLIDISSGGGGSQNLQQVTNEGSTTTNPITAASFIKQGGTGTNILLDNGNTVSLSSIGGNTNLTTSQTASNFTINSDTGTDAIVPLGNGTLAGATLNDYTTAEKTKLAAITGTNTGDQDLQSVTDIGATTTNEITITVGDGGANGITSYSSQGIGVRGESSEFFGVYGTSASGAGVYGFSGSEGVIGEGLTGVKGVGTSIGVDGNSSTGVGVIAQTGTGIGVSAVSESDGTALYAYSTSGKGIEVNGNGTIAIDVILGNLNKGLVVNSGTSSTGNFIELAKNSVNKLVVNQAGELTATKLIKQGGFDYQFLKADGSVDNNIYLTSADLPSTLDLYATTTASDISGYTVLVRNISDTRYNTTAIDVSTGVITSIGQLVGSLVTDANIISGNPGVFDFKTIGNISRTSGTGQAEFFFRIYKRNLAGTETLIAQSDYTLPVTNGGYVEFSATALWNDGIFLDTDRVVLKYYANRLTSPVGSDPTYQFQFGGTSPVRSSAAIPTSVMPNIYLRDLADVENVDALNNEVLYWNDPASLWEHSLVENLVPDASATQKGLVSTTTQTFAGSKTFTDTIYATSENDYAISAISTNSEGLSAESTNGNGVVSVSVNGMGGVFATTNNANIAQFQTGFDIKATVKADGTFAGTGLNASGQTINTIASFDASKNVVSLSTATYPSLTELALLKGVSGGSVQTQLDGKVDENTAITGATKTKITYDSKGLVTAGADATTADIADSTNKRYVTDANLVVIGNTSGTNTGDNATNTQYSGLAASKQDTLQNTVNIKSINGNSILGSGDLTISGTGISSLNGLTGATQTFSVFTNFIGSPSFSSTGINHQLKLPNAGPTTDYGLITNTSQYIGGGKTFIDSISIPAPVPANPISVRCIVLGDSQGGLIVGSTTLYPTAQEMQYVKGITSSVQTQLNGKASGLDVAEQTYSLSPTFTGTAPTIISSSTYKWNQVGTLVTGRVNLIYTTAGSISQVVIPLPADMPTPLAPTGLSGALDILYYGVGMFNTTTTTVSALTRSCLLRRNTANTGYEFVITHTTAVSSRVISLTLQYFT